MYLGGFSCEAHAGMAHDIMALKCRGPDSAHQSPTPSQKCRTKILTPSDLLFILHHCIQLL